MAPLHEMNPTGRFSDRADDYVKYRPGYPTAAIDALLAGAALTKDTLAADIGAGTGISARLLGDRGVSVIAVEPNDAMREAAATHPNVTWRSGTAERTGLATRSVDLVLCAQAFHWFRADEALREFARILRPGKKLALVWNRRSEDDPFTAGYREALLEVGAASTAERMDFDERAIARSGLFLPLQLSVFPNHQTLDRAGLLGRAMSASYAPKAGPLADKLVELLGRLHERFADERGLATLVYNTEVYSAMTRESTV